MRSLRSSKQPRRVKLKNSQITTSSYRWGLASLVAEGKEWKSHEVKQKKYVDKYAKKAEREAKRPEQGAKIMKTVDITDEVDALIVKGNEKRSNEEKEKEAKQDEEEAKGKGKEKRMLEATGENEGLGQEVLLRIAKRAAAAKTIAATKEEDSWLESEQAPTGISAHPAEGAPLLSPVPVPGPRLQFQPWLSPTVQDEPDPEPTLAPLTQSYPQPQRQKPTMEPNTKEGDISLERAHALHQARLAELKRSRAKADAMSEPEMETEKGEKSEATKSIARLKTLPPPSNLVFLKQR